MKKAIVAFCAFLSTGTIACTDDSRSAEALRKAGFTDIRLTGYSYFACGEDDAFRTDFVAKNPQGVDVSGTVCCGWLKSCTIRF